jgi:hypothetical protein
MQEKKQVKGQFYAYGKMFRPASLVNVFRKYRYLLLEIHSELVKPNIIT